MKRVIFCIIAIFALPILAGEPPYSDEGNARRFDSTQKIHFKNTSLKDFAAMNVKSGINSSIRLGKLITQMESLIRINKKLAEQNEQKLDLLESLLEKISK